VWVVAEGGWGGSARVRAVAAMVVGGVHVWAAVLRCAVARADGEGGLRWPEPMVEAACMHVWAPRSSARASGDAPSSDPVR
jgi:hypothetical protein